MFTKVLVLERVQGAADLRCTTNRRQFPNGKNAKSFRVLVIRTSTYADGHRTVVEAGMILTVHAHPESSVKTSSSQALAVCSLVDPCLW